ncbi:DUF4912 domain-containing protein [Nodularia spumigena]|uniref:DUF4912 domain-containing protein n=1 Tax=Nodularia spumigena UHCC 0060 TaxID=3110300 RepID=A0ABU5UPT2_NODSP|nr:DUF4912 domain-containing protein [Nodularia spumigena]MEA5608264.1 DUF4912 domain-containing protein [Nodularia spumigena UHCC 0060]MEA5612339.1 DUF4912 domain-containing protein [Nodularia spumigena UHCC 0040]
MMWQQEKKDSAIVSLALLLSLATTPMAVHLFVPTPVLAQSATEAESFPLPETLENGTKVRIDGSMSLTAINQSFKQSFEQKYSGTNVEVTANGTNAAISALIDGKVDLIAISRALTPEEQAQGLAQVKFYEEKIAIIVNTDNPFLGILTDQQFADIFRGKITKWSELGGNEGTIRFIDRPESSETRQRFRTYPSFQGAELTTGSNATQIETDNTAEIVQQLGKDGISYAMVHHLSQLPNQRAIPINQTLPDNPNYVYSQPLYYAYRQNPSPNVASFLGFVLGSEQQTIQAAINAASGLLATPPAPQEEPETVTNPTVDPQTIADGQQPPETTFIPDEIPLWWLLLPTAVIVGLLTWVFRSRLWTNQAENKAPKGEDEASTVIDDTSITPLVGEPLAETASNDAGEEVDEQKSFRTSDYSNFTELEFVDDEQSPWDIEAPASVVNIPYPQLADVSKVTAEQPQVPEVGSDAQIWEMKDSSDETAEQPQVESDLIEEIISHETTDLPEDMDTEANVWDETPDNQVETSHPTLPEIPEDILNSVADAAEPINDETVFEQPDERNIFADGDTFDSESEGEVVNITTEEPVFNLNGEQSIVLQPRNAEWVYATWYIEPSSQQALQNNGISQLGLRLYDVTDLDLSDQSPQLVQHYELESEIERYMPIPQCDRDYMAEIGYITQGDRWVKIARSPKVRVLATPPEDTTADPGFNLDGEQSIVLKPRNAEWAYATWYIEPSCQQALQNHGISQLGLRLYDVTDLDLSDQTPQLVLHYELESKIEEKYIAIPQSDRDYMAEIGYITEGDRWVKIGRSKGIRVFGLPLTDSTAENLPTADTTFVDLPQTNHESTIILESRTIKWAYASWYISPTDQQILQNHRSSQLYLRLYNVTDVDLSSQTPQVVQQYECDDITRDRYVSIPATDHEYIAEIGYITQANRWEMIVRSERIRVFSRPQADFWFLADTELIIHGATEPGATVNIAGKPIKIKPDGTFHLRIPFSNNSMNYIMTAIAANGEHSQTIQKTFSQENSQP